MIRWILYSLLSLSIIMLHPASVSAQVNRALLIGISEYPDEGGWTTIHGATDVLRLEKTLCQKNFKVTKLIDKEATYENITKALDKLIEQTHEGDGIYLHFSCHGQPFEDLDGDETDGWDEAIVPYDAPQSYKKDHYEGEKHLTDDKLNQYLKALRKKAGTKGYLAAVMDACHAGTSYRGEEEAPVRGTNRGFSRKNQLYRPNKLEKANTYQIVNENGLSPIVIWEACRPYQQNREIKEEGQFMGALSWYVEQKLSGSGSWRDAHWIEQVQEAMKADIRLTNQNMVIEKSGGICN